MNKILSLATATVIVSGLLSVPFAASPAQAAELKLKAVASGQSYITLNWDKVSDARKYEFQISKNKDFSKSTTIVRVNSATASKLDNATVYHIRYRALVGKSLKATSWSKPISRETEAAFPGVFTTLKATPAKDAINISWNKNTNTTEWTVKVSSDPAMVRNVKTYKTKNTSIMVKDLPAKTASGDPNFIRVYATNKGKKTRTSIRFTGFPSAVKAVGTEKIRIGSYNTLCVSCTDKRATWDSRKHMVMNRIASYSPDVVGLQEVSITKVGGGKRQAEEFASLIKAKGYTMVNSKNFENGWLGFQGNRIIYKTAKYSVVQHGEFRVITDKGTENMRYAAWARLKSKATGKEFIMTSIHLDNRQTSNVRRLKALNTKQIVDTIQQKAGSKTLPIMIVGDFNASLYSDPENKIRSVMTNNGYYDMSAAVKKVKNDYSTYNDYLRATKLSWSRPDYIFTKNMTGSDYYENAIKVSNGQIVGDLPSDHNLIIADGKLP